MEQESSVVALMWFNKKDPSFQHLCTGFIINKDLYGISILTVSEFIAKLSHDAPQNPIPKSDIGVKVAFFDQRTIMSADVLHYDMTLNLAALFIKPCTEFDNHPLPCIQAATMSTDPTYKGQFVKSTHHAIFYDDNGTPKGPFNQFTEGFVADNSHFDSGTIHFSMPLIFGGSLGAPVFDKHSNRLVSMIQSWESGQGEPLAEPFQVQYWSDVENKYFGLTVPRIQQFIAEVLAIVRAGS